MIPAHDVYRKGTHCRNHKDYEQHKKGIQPLSFRIGVVVVYAGAEAEQISSSNYAGGNYNYGKQRLRCKLGIATAGTNHSEKTALGASFPVRQAT